MYTRVCFHTKKRERHSIFSVATSFNPCFFFTDFTSIIHGRQGKIAPERANHENLPACVSQARTITQITLPQPCRPHSTLLPSALQGIVQRRVEGGGRGGGGNRQNFLLGNFVGVVHTRAVISRHVALSHSSREQQSATTAHHHQRLKHANEVKKLKNDYTDSAFNAAKTSDFWILVSSALSALPE